MGRVASLLLTPGAGADRDHHTLLAVAGALADLPVPIATRRVDFPYRIAGRRMPDRAPVAIAHVVAAVESFAAELGVGTSQVAIGGRSYGGRMCSMAVAGGLPAAALVLLSYPLHPPGRPDRPRVEHFAAIRVPTLFVSGDRDPFGSPAEFAASIGPIPGRVEQVWLPGAHDVRGRDREIALAVARWITAAVD